jgi:hypothetical protein
MEKNIIIKVCQNDIIPGFGGYLEGSVKEGAPLIMINIKDIISLVEEGSFFSEDIPYVVADTIMHEVIHALEEWAGVEFNEDKIETLLFEYRKLKK